MVIRKLFKFEASHIVRNCSTERCSHSIHGHSYKVEVFLTAPSLDRADMIMDFSRVKDSIGSFLDAFDHSYMAWSEDLMDLNAAMIRHSRRYIEFPIIPSAESMSLMFLHYISKILDDMAPENNEGCVSVTSVRVHETDTGYAEAFAGDQFRYLDKRTLGIGLSFSSDCASKWDGKLLAILGKEKE